MPFARLLAFLKRYLHNSKYRTPHAIALIFFTLLMLFFGNRFEINALFDHPQFTEWAETEAFVKAIDEEGKGFWYYGFFVVDAIWAPLLLTFLYRLLYRLRFKARRFRNDKSIHLFAGIIALAYVSDLLEGFFYVFGKFAALEDWSVYLKIALYVVAGLFFIYGLSKYWFPPNRRGGLRKRYYLKSLKVFFATCYISIVLVLILILLAGLPQGYTMVVDLLARPLNLLGAFLLLLLLSLVVSHYPAYLEAKKFIDPDRIDWHIWPNKKWAPLGLIYYNFKQGDDKSDRAKVKWINAHFSQGFSRVSQTLRYHLGTAMFVSFLYLLGYAGQSIFQDYWFSTDWAWGILLFGIWLQSWLQKQDAKPELRRKVFIISSLTSLALMIVTVSVSAFSSYGWNKATLSLTIITTVFLMISYIAFRWTRRTLLNDYVDKIINGQTVQLKSTRKLVWLISRLSFISLLFLLAYNVEPALAENHSSSITVILLYALNYYGVVVILIKVSQLYGEKEFRTRPLASLFRFGVPLIFPVLFAYSFVITGLSRNQLHYLEKIPETTTINLDDYTTTFAANNTDSIAPIMYTSYGGGLMADLWAMLITQELQEATDGAFLKHTFNMSGNSGGAVGFGNYTNLSYYNTDPLHDSSWDEAITKVGQFNHLSLDLTFLLGRDMFRKFVPVRKDTRIDRNGYAMRRYAEITRDTATESFSRTFRSHWAKVYERQDSMFPSLTVSTTAVSDGGLGNAFSLKTQHDTVFHGIENVLDIRGEAQDASLIYYDAVSTSNRFPMLSSAAAIAGKGQFIDGGAYDNSGLLNSLELAEAVPYFEKHPPKFVTIQNDTYAYIDWLFNRYKETDLKENITGEISALVKAGVVIDRFSEHLEAEVDSRDTSRIEIFLPRIISYEQVLAYLGGKPKDKQRAGPEGGKLAAIMAVVKKENDRIRALLETTESAQYKQWGAVQAPLARLLTEPAIEYEKAMLNHPYVKAQLQKVVDMFVNCTH